MYLLTGKKGLLLNIITLIDPARMEFKSISEKVHAAASYEREIHDLVWDLSPVGHPNRKKT